MAVVQSVRQTTGEAYVSVCRELGVNYANLMRWKRRQAAGETVIRQPGPAKLAPLDQNALTQEIHRLACGRERTHGTGTLFARHRDAISRRDLQVLVAAVRNEVQRVEQSLARQIEWLLAAVVWSMDDAEVEAADGRRIHLNVVHDLGSRYTLRVLGDEKLADGPTIARNLAALFKQHGPPLFFKRDNGGNLNHAAVNAVFGEHGVIALNSPTHYPPYNGGMEHKQLEIKKHLGSQFIAAPVGLPELILAAELSGHDLNHVRRPILGHRTACHALERGRPFLSQFHQRKRREVFADIKELAVDIEARLERKRPVNRRGGFRAAAGGAMNQAGFQTSGRSARSCAGFVFAAGRRRKTSHR